MIGQLLDPFVIRVLHAFGGKLLLQDPLDGFQVVGIRPLHHHGHKWRKQFEKSGRPAPVSQRHPRAVSADRFESVCGFHRERTVSGPHNHFCI